MKRIASPWLVGLALATGSADPGLSGSRPATASASDETRSPSRSVVSLNEGAMVWRIGENADPGWLVQHSLDLQSWTALGDPLVIAPRAGPNLSLPLAQHHSPWFFRALPANRTVREALLREQWERWKATGPRTYTFEFRWSCFCFPDYTQWVRIATTNGTITSVRRVSDGQELDAEASSRYVTLDGLFAWLTEAFAQDAARVDVSYDPGLGYPLAGFVDRHELVVDEEMAFQARLIGPAAAMVLTQPPASWPGDPYVIEAAKVEGDWLEVDVAYSGGCVDPHGWELSAVPEPPAAELPIVVHLYLTHDARGDTCEAYPRKTLAFALGPLRAWHAARDLAPHSPPMRLRLALHHPTRDPNAPVTFLDYGWDKERLGEGREVIAATAQTWHGGVPGSGWGTDYILTLSFPPAWGDAVRIRTLWIDGRAFTPEVMWAHSRSGGGRLATLTAGLRMVPILDPDDPRRVLGFEEQPPQDPQAPKFDGAALLITEALGATQEWLIQRLQTLDPLFYP